MFEHFSVKQPLPMLIPRFIPLREKYQLFGCVRTVAASGMQKVYLSKPIWFPFKKGIGSSIFRPGVVQSALPHDLIPSWYSPATDEARFQVIFNLIRVHRLLNYIIREGLFHRAIKLKLVR